MSLQDAKNRGPPAPYWTDIRLRKLAVDEDLELDGNLVLTGPSEFSGAVTFTGPVEMQSGLDITTADQLIVNQPATFNDDAVFTATGANNVPVFQDGFIVGNNAGDASYWLQNYRREQDQADTTGEVDCSVNDTLNVRFEKLGEHIFCSLTTNGTGSIVKNGLGRTFSFDVSNNDLFAMLLSSPVTSTVAFTGSDAAGNPIICRVEPTKFGVDIVRFLCNCVTGNISDLAVIMGNNQRVSMLLYGN